MYARFQQEVTEFLSDYLRNDKIKEMDHYIQHGDVTTLQHCLAVATISLIIVRIFGLKVNLSVLLIGALLHDFFLYDWHDNEPKPLFEKHGFTHPAAASANARKYFDLDDATLGVIETHMFPLTISKVPRSREAIVVCLADKIAASRETLSLETYIK